MAWTKKELKECTKFGHLFVICRVDVDGYVCREISWRSSKKLGFRDNLAQLCGLSNIKDGAKPEVGDFIFYAAGEKEWSSLLKPHHLEHPVRVVDFEKYCERISHERAAFRHATPRKTYF